MPAVDPSSLWKNLVVWKSHQLLSSRRRARESAGHEPTLQMKRSFGRSAQHRKRPQRNPALLISSFATEEMQEMSCPAMFLPTQVDKYLNAPARTQTHTRTNPGPYSANDVQSSHSPARPSGGALLCKPLCVFNKTQGGRTQIKASLCSFVLCSSSPDYRRCSSAPL